MLKPKRFSDKQLEDVEEMETEHCRAAALIAGANKIMTDFVNGSSWGTRITIDVASELLEEAGLAEDAAMLAMKSSQKTSPGRAVENPAKPKSRRRPNHNV